MFTNDDDYCFVYNTLDVCVGRATRIIICFQFRFESTGRRRLKKKRFNSAKPSRNEYTKTGLVVGVYIRGTLEDAIKTATVTYEYDI